MSRCQQCQTISSVTIPVDLSNPGSTTKIYMHTVDTFIQAVDDGCYFCTKFRKWMFVGTKARRKKAEFPGICCSVWRFGSSFGLEFEMRGGVSRSIELFKVSPSSKLRNLESQLRTYNTTQLWYDILLRA